MARLKAADGTEFVVDGPYGEDEGGGYDVYFINSSGAIRYLCPDGRLRTAAEVGDTGIHVWPNAGYASIVALLATYPKPPLPPEDW